VAAVACRRLPLLLLLLAGGGAIAAALRLHIIAARALVSSALHGMCSTLCCQPRLILEQCNNGQSPALGEKGDEQNKTKEMEGE
jgi:hypothetical protein